MVFVAVRYEGGKKFFAGDKAVLSFRDGLVAVTVDGELKAIFYLDGLIEVSVEDGAEGEEE